MSTRPVLYFSINILKCHWVFRLAPICERFHKSLSRSAIGDEAIFATFDCSLLMNSADLQLEKSDFTVEKAEAFQQIWSLLCFG